MLFSDDRFLSSDQDIVDFHPTHLDGLQLRASELEQIRAAPGVLQRIQDQAGDGLSWTGTRGGHPICVFGIRPLWNGVAEAWMIPGAGIERAPISLVKGGRQLFEDAIADLRLQRLQITVRCQNDTHIKFATLLHFHIESTLKRYGPLGDDFYMMVWGK